MVLIHSPNPPPQGLSLHISEELLTEIPSDQLTRRTVGSYIQKMLPSTKYKRPDSAIITVKDGNRSVIGLGNLVSRKTADRLRDKGANVLDLEEDS